MKVPPSACRRVARASALIFILAIVAVLAIAISRLTSSVGTARATVASERALRTNKPPQIVPKPVAMTAGRAVFVLTRRTRIAVVGGPAARAVARDLGGYLRPATGFKLPVVSGRGGRGDISITLARRDAMHRDPDGEGYRLHVTNARTMLTGSTAHGLYNGVQTVRQLLPVWINSSSVRPGPWTMPAVRITDYPRYVYRGLMLDIARHYESPSAVERLIAQAAAYKINVFHLHLSDDQGFRLVIKGFPRLTKVGGRGSLGTHGRKMDPGGFWTQAQYRAVVADAKAHFMTLVPEVDSPGHTNAIMMSEYFDTHNPRLHHPHSIDCGKHKPPRWNYTQAVGYSALCPNSRDTWALMRAIIDQIAALTAGSYYDVGGDEVPHSVLSQSKYAAFINKEAPLVHRARKRVMAWADAATRGTKLHGPSVAEYWNPASGSQSGTNTGRDAARKGMKVVMSPANHAYLDQKYKSGKAGNVPPTLGQNWACPRGCDVDRFYNWNPGAYVRGVTDHNVIGVEGAMWGETVVDLSNVDYMVFPRLPALAEVAWSRKLNRSSRKSPAYRAFVRRLAAQGGRLMAGGINFYPTPEVPWRLDLIGSQVASGSRRKVSGKIATLSAPGRALRRVKTTIRWGDGATSTGTLSGRAATRTRVNGLYTVAGNHRYRHPGHYVGTVTVSAPGGARAAAKFVVVAPG